MINFSTGSAAIFSNLLNGIKANQQTQTQNDSASSDAGTASKRSHRMTSENSVILDEYVPSTTATDETDIPFGGATKKFDLDFTLEENGSLNFTSKVEGSRASTDAEKPSQKVDLSSVFSKVQGGAKSGVAKATEEMFHELQRAMYQGVISRVVEKNGVKMGSGDRLNITLNGKGEFDIDSKSSKLNGYDEETLGSTCIAIASDLNNTKLDGQSLGESMLKFFAKDMGFDYDAIKGNEDFTISFSFRYNDKTGQSEMLNARIVDSLEQIERFGSDASAKLAERKAKQAEKAAEAVAAETTGATESKTSETSEVDETEDSETNIPSGPITGEQLEQAYQDRYVKRVDGSTLNYNLLDQRAQVGHRIENGKLVPVAREIPTLQEWLKDNPMGEVEMTPPGTTEGSSKPPEGDILTPTGEIGVIRVMFIQDTHELLDVDGMEVNALFHHKMRDINNDGEYAEAYQQRVEDETASLNNRIADLLSEKGIELADDETLNFNVGLDGRISLGEGVADEAKAAAIEQALNEDESLGRAFLLNHVKQDLANRETRENDFYKDETNSRIVAAELLRQQTGLSIDDVGFNAETISFYDKNGNVDLTDVCKEYMVFQGLFNSFTWQDDGYVAAEPLSVAFQFAK